MNLNIPYPTQDYMVNISCMTYNHEKYIEDALKGFVMQKTNFSFCALVIDDASTDGTAEIIRKYEKEYPDIIKAVYLNENHYSQHKSKREYYTPWRERSKYIAICEGDDYWIDPYKLQKQVDYLEEHPEYGLIRTNYNKYYQAEDRFEHAINDKESYIKDTFEDYLINAWFMAPCTIMYRKEYSNIHFLRKFSVGTLPIVLEAALNSKIACLPDITTVYRVLNNSASHFNDYKKRISFIDGIYDIQVFFVYRSKRFDLLQNAKIKTLKAKYSYAFSYKKRKDTIKYIYSIGIAENNQTSISLIRNLQKYKLLNLYWLYLLYQSWYKKIIYQIKHTIWLLLNK